MKRIKQIFCNHKVVPHIIEFKDGTIEHDGFMCYKCHYFISLNKSKNLLNEFDCDIKKLKEGIKIYYNPKSI